MMVGDQYAHTQRIGGGHAVDARDAVVDRDQDVGVLELLGECHDFRRQAVAVFETVGHQEFDVGAELAQRAHADRARRGAVGIVISDDQQALLRGNRVREQTRHAFQVMQSCERRESAEVGSKLLRRCNAARGVNLREQRVYAGRGERRLRCRRGCTSGYVEVHGCFTRVRHKLRAGGRAARTAACPLLLQSLQAGFRCCRRSA